MTLLECRMFIRYFVQLALYPNPSRADAAIVTTRQFRASDRGRLSMSCDSSSQPSAESFFRLLIFGSFLRGSILRIYGVTHTLPGATRSAFGTSVISRILCQPAFFGGLARNVSRYWCASRFPASSRNGAKDTGGPVNPM